MTGHVFVVFGTRPEGIKMIPVIRALRAKPGLRITVAVTGQHRQMLDQVFAAFDERPDIDLDLMTHGQTLPGITSAVLLRLSEVLTEHRPDVVLVHGDTTTAMASALAAFYAGIKIGHVEAGLRSFDLSRPWPEEFNRVCVDSIADYMFAPTSSARENLMGEYNKRGEIHVTGNTGIDALLWMSEHIDGNAALRDSLAKKYDFIDSARSLVLVTGHRRESFGKGFQEICESLARLSARGDAQIVYPVHLNPNVRGVVMESLGGAKNVNLIEPVEYVDMVYLMKQARILLTDSGGIQEEGPALGRPVLVMREVTERPEAIHTGVVKLVGTDPDLITSEVGRLLDDETAYKEMARPVFPYGDGKAGTRIADILEGKFRP